MTKKGSLQMSKNNKQNLKSTKLDLGENVQNKKSNKIS